MVEDRGFEPTSKEHSTVSGMGRQGTSKGKLASQAGHPQEVTQTPDVMERTDAGKDRASTGRPESIESAQQEHNRSTTADAMPTDLARVVDAWPTLPPNIKAAIRALLDTTGGK